MGSAEQSFFWSENSGSYLTTRSSSSFRWMSTMMDANSFLPFSTKLFLAMIAFCDKPFISVVILSTITMRIYPNSANIPSSVRYLAKSVWLYENALSNFLCTWIRSCWIANISCSILKRQNLSKKVIIAFQKQLSRFCAPCKALKLDLALSSEDSWTLHVHRRMRAS